MPDKLDLPGVRGGGAEMEDDTISVFGGKGGGGGPMVQLNLIEAAEVG